MKVNRSMHLANEVPMFPAKTQEALISKSDSSLRYREPRHKRAKRIPSSIFGQMIKEEEVQADALVTFCNAFAHRSRALTERAAMAREDDDFGV
jgi:hypothetical protein